MEHCFISFKLIWTKTNQGMDWRCAGLLSTYWRVHVLFLRAIADFHLLAPWARKKYACLWRVTFPYQEKREYEETHTFVKSFSFKVCKYAVWSDSCFQSQKDSKTIGTIICLVTTMNFVMVIEIFLHWVLYCEWDFLSMARTCHSWARSKHCYCPKLSQKNPQNNPTEIGMKYSLGIVESTCRTYCFRLQCL